jgi:drug/metabolite transporter (DMT)-like permease
MPTASQVRTSRALVWVGLLVLYLVWGSTYLGIRIAVETIPPFIMASTRFLIAGLALFAWSLLREGTAFAWPTRREWRDNFIVGALLLGGGMGLVSWGEQTVPSGIAALLIAMMPVWVAVLGRVFLGHRLPRLAVAGITVGLAGVAILVGGPESGDRLDPAGVAALLISPISWSAGSLYAANRVPRSSRPLVATAMQMLCGAAVLAIAAIVTGEPGRLRVELISSSSIIAVAYLTVVGSLLAFSTYVWLLRVAPLPLIATYAYVNPVVAVVLGAVVLGETLTPTKLVAGGVIVFAVAVIITASGRMRRPSVGTEADGLPAPPSAAARPIPAPDA